MAVRDGNILIFDGACGTNLQRMEIPVSAWEGRDGCNEFLNVSAPEIIREWHSSFLSAGATVLETNTFGANAIVLAEYGLADRVTEINRAAVGNAHEAIRRHGGPAYVAGSIGPTTKLPSLGHIAFGPMAEASNNAVLLPALVVKLSTCSAASGFDSPIPTLPPLFLN